MVTAPVNLLDFIAEHPQWAGSIVATGVTRPPAFPLPPAAMPDFLRWMVARHSAAPRWAEATYSDLRRQRPDLFPEPTLYPAEKRPQ